MARLAALLIALVALTAAVGAQKKDSIRGSKHDFRAATARSAGGDDVCLYCHTPHDAETGAYLWNRQLPREGPQGYRSRTLPSGPADLAAGDTSKLCLSCHDGTIALTDQAGGRSALPGEARRVSVSARSNLIAGLGFSDDHPFAIALEPGSKTRVPAKAEAVRLDAAGRLQCTSCHEPHEEFRDQVMGKFLVKPNPASALCLSCHIQPGWMGASHRQPGNAATNMSYSSTQGAHTGYVGVADNGCSSCHRAHGGQMTGRLLKFEEENTCFACHDGSVAEPARNIRAEFQLKLYRHPVQNTPSVHDADEGPTSGTAPLPETSASAPRHAECADCHNPHFANPGAARAPLTPGSLAGVNGVAVNGAALPRAAYEYELCFKCHADSANKPQFFDSSVAGIGFGRLPQRQFDVENPDRFNTRMEFGFSASFHPVTRPRNLSVGPGGEVPSLRPAMVSPGGEPLGDRTLSGSTLIYCTDCHANDTGRNLGEAGGPRGVHASNYPHLLERASHVEPPPATPGGISAGVGYSPSEYALCAKCHDVEGSVLADRSFRYHRKHVVEQNAACATCHDPHASALPRLINFDLSVVAPASTGRLEFRKEGFAGGTCSLRCHGVEHNSRRY